MSDEVNILFEVPTPLGFTVRTTAQYWEKIVVKHPDLENCVEVAKQALATPDEIRRSSRDEHVLLFYLSVRAERWVVPWQAA